MAGEPFLNTVACCKNFFTNNINKLKSSIKTRGSKPKKRKKGFYCCEELLYFCKASHGTKRCSSMLGCTPKLTANNGVGLKRTTFWSHFHSPIKDDWTLQPGAAYPPPRNTCAISSPLVPLPPCLFEELPLTCYAHPPQGVTMLEETQYLCHC